MKENNDKNSKNVTNNKKVIIILDVVLIIVAVILAIFLGIIINNRKNNSNENGINFVTEQISTNIDNEKMSEYSSDILGIKFKYYNELERVSDVTENSMFLNAGMFREEGNEGINVLIGKLKETLSFEDYLYSNIYAIMDSNHLEAKDIEVVKDNVNMGDLKSFKIRYKLNDVNMYQMMVQKDGKEYIMTYSAEDLYFDKQRADNMFSTFEFVN